MSFYCQVAVLFFSLRRLTTVFVRSEQAFVERDWCGLGDKNAGSFRNVYLRQSMEDFLYSSLFS